MTPYAMEEGGRGVPKSDLYQVSVMLQQCKVVNDKWVKFCRVVELHGGGSATNGATLSSFKVGTTDQNWFSAFVF